MTKKALLLAALLLAPATSFAKASEGPVVRPQLYGAGNKIEVGVVAGYVSNDPYYRVINPGLVVTYHFNDRSAIEIHGGMGLHSPKQLLSQVRQKIGRDPDIISRPQFFVTGNYMWAPIYGKINAFGEVVLHYDLYVLAGLGIVMDEIETNTAGSPSQKTIATQVFPATDFAIGQHFFLSKRTALRFELRPYIFWEQIDNKWDPNGDVQILGGFSLLF